MRSDFNNGSHHRHRPDRTGPREMPPSEREGSCGPGALSPIPPLHWWRRLPADVFSPLHVCVIRRALSGISFLNEPHWCEAAKGDPAAAIGVALRVARRRGTTAPIIDLVMSAVLLAALSGDMSAILMLATMIKRTGGPAVRDDLIASWLNPPAKTGNPTAATNIDKVSNLPARSDGGV
ncbi:MAG: hypothetical protein JSR61_17435 [Proteobacteria bacterium]|nr:hypothetical protein [Pseudomonadota bacterium]